MRCARTAWWCGSWLSQFWYTLLRNLHHRVIKVPASWQPVVKTLLNYHGLVLTVWLLAVVVLIGVQFWDFWRTVIT